MLHLASAIAYGTTGMPPIEWLDDNHRRASINGKAVELEDIRRFVFERLEAAKIVLEKEVMFGHKFEELGFTSAKVVGALRIGRSNVLKYVLKYSPSPNRTTIIRSEAT